MVIMEQVMDSINHQTTDVAVIKGKRTKRQKLPPAKTAAAASPSTSSSVTEEEEDMANCLILLAQSSAPPAPCGGSARVAVFECKTCNKCFPSFQALGGHRTSHKRLKKDFVEEAEEDYNGNMQKFLSFGTSNSAMINIKQRVHECSICGAGFSSGQALGGHMRRHRQPDPTIASGKPKERKVEKTLLSLDLNLPAPSPDSGDIGGNFSSFFSSSLALDHCRYSVIS